MIVFDLDGTLANCEHRRHLVDPEKYPSICKYSNYYIDENGDPIIDLDGKASWRYKNTGKPFQHGWPAYYEACDKDEIIEPVIRTFRYLMTRYTSSTQKINWQIWSGRCESVRKKTEDWLDKHIITLGFGPDRLKMRPIGNTTPDDALKEQWLNERCADLITAETKGIIPVKHDVDFVFDSDPESIAMWRRRGIFVFNCLQSGGAF